MSPYRLPPARPRPAPAAPWWRVAWAVLSRELTRRLVERAMRRRALVLPLPESIRSLSPTQWIDLHPFTRNRILDALHRERERERPWLTEEEGQRAYDAVPDAKGNFIGEQRPRWNIGNRAPLSGLGRSVLM